MPRGPRGEKRPADVIGNAVKITRIAIGEETEELENDRVKSAAAELRARGRESASLTSAQRTAIAQAAAKARWRR
jgi:hypothetical protein